MSLEDLRKKCVIPSKECDNLVQTYCINNPSDEDFCGCSTNVLKNIPDPAMGNSPVKCWAKSCTQNANSYQFHSYQTEKCPDICIDKSTITAIGSNISSSAFNQSSCGNKAVEDSSVSVTKTLTHLYSVGINYSIVNLLLMIIIFSSMSSILSVL